MTQRKIQAYVFFNVSKYTVNLNFKSFKRKMKSKNNIKFKEKLKLALKSVNKDNNNSQDRV